MRLDVNFGWTQEVNLPVPRGAIPAIDANRAGWPALNSRDSLPIYEPRERVEYTVPVTALNPVSFLSAIFSIWLVVPGARIYQWQTGMV